MYYVLLFFDVRKSYIFLQFIKSVLLFERSSLPYIALFVVVVIITMIIVVIIIVIIVVFIIVMSIIINNNGIAGLRLRCNSSI